MIYGIIFEKVIPPKPQGVENDAVRFARFGGVEFVEP
jgi:hypothetical protein